ncbi:MAG: putative Inosine/uridine-preferring nucleoside hydrolase [Promethearchaeota archaeon]|nr:MAG: putative Inosine/uridine-preferring nucleoside hydrolase [Candidatus Lokiarchaeota archaeon]
MERILIDTDPGLGKKGADVDDGLALFLIFNNPEVFKVEAITSVFGNTRVKKGFELLKRYLDLFDKKDIPYAMGAKSSRDLGKITQATELLMNLVKENPGEITLFILGPLTNIATTLEHYPALLDDLKEIIFMGGTLEPHNLVHIRDPFSKTEFNFFSDAEATKKFLETETKTEKIGMGLDICMQVFFEDKHLDMLKSVDKPIQNFISEHTEYWLELWKRKNNRGFYPFDVFVPMYKLEPKFFEIKEFYVKVDVSEISGRLFYSETPKREHVKVKYAVDFTEEKNKEEFMNRLIQDLSK